jgi:hypothetical protein
MEDRNIYRIIPFNGYGLKSIVEKQALTFVIFSHQQVDQFSPLFDGSHGDGADEYSAFP